MQTDFYPITVQEVKKETPDCVSVTFNVPEALQEQFRYKHGQYLTIKTLLEGVEVRRTYSICSSPLDNTWRVAIKKLPGGSFSVFANEGLKPGDVLELMAPNGNFTRQLSPAAAKNYMAFAAGSGITPILSIIETTLRTEPLSQFTLVYGNRFRNHIIFREELEALKNRFIDRFSICYILSAEKTDAALNYGRIDKEKCELIFTKLARATEVDDYFICGPQEMTFTVRDYLLLQNVAASKIHFELFTSGNRITGQPRNEKLESKVASSRIIIKKDGRESAFDLPYEGESILDAAIHEGADLPYACKAGVCCTCRARLTAGEVIMDVNYGLDPEEVAAGYILTCQSHPVSSMVKVDYDQS